MYFILLYYDNDIERRNRERDKQRDISHISQILIFINNAGGPIVNEDALLKALNKNQIHSVGLDVYHDEPPLPQNDALINHPYVITSGHYSYYSDTGMEALQKRITENMV